MTEVKRKVALPDGRVVDLMVPADATVEEIQDFAMAQWDAGKFDKGFVPKNVMVSSPKAQMPQGEIQPTFRSTVESIAEPLAQMATGAAATLPAGFAGLGATLFQGPKAGGDVVNKILSDYTYQPKTAAGQRGAQYVRELSDRYLGKEGLGITNVPEEAGAQILEQTGSPELATAYHTLPAFLEAITGLSALQTARGPVRLLDDQGYPTEMLNNLLNEYGLNYDNLTPEARALINQTAYRSLSGTPSVPTGRITRTDIESGGTQRGLSLYDPDTLKGPFAGVNVDPLAQRAFEADWEKGVIQMVKAADPVTKFNLGRMLSDMRKLKSDEGTMAFPSKIVGEAAGSRVDVLSDRIKNDAMQLNIIANNNLKGMQVDIQRITDAVQKGLDELRVQYKLDPKFGDPRFADAEGNADLNFDSSLIQESPAGREMVNAVVRLLAKARSGDAADLHNLKRQIDELIDWSKSSDIGISEKGRTFAKNIRYEANEQLRGLDAEYERLNDRLSTNIEARNTLGEAVTRRIREEINGNIDSWDGLGAELRKLYSNYGNQSALVEALEGLDAAIAKTGTAGQKLPVVGGGSTGKVADTSNLAILARFGLALDKQFGSAKAGSFQGQQEAAFGKAINRMPKGVIADTATATFMDKLARRNQQQIIERNELEAFNAMMELIRKGGK